MSEPIRQITTTIRLNAATKVLEQYKCVPVILIGVQIENQSVFAFTLDTTLTNEECLQICEATVELLKSELKKKSITKYS
jgi:hypothetical protein